LSYWQVLARVLRPGTSLLAMVRLATTCAAAALLGWRRAFTEDDLPTAPGWKGATPSSSDASGRAGPPNPRNNSFFTT
jgi:hypothetical protein